MSAARKHSEEPELKIFSAETYSSATSIAKAPNDSDAFEQLFRSLVSLLPDGDFFIGCQSAFVPTFQVEWASGVFAHLQNQSLDFSRSESLAFCTEGPDGMRLMNGKDLAATETAFTNLGAGQALLIRISMAEDVARLITYWQAEKHGPIAPERMQAIRVIADFAGRAARAGDLALDIQAQQLHLNTLRAEVEDIQQFYRRFADTIRQCFWVVDIESNRVLMISDNFERVWGAEKQILYDGISGFMSTVLPEDRDRVLAEFHHRLGSEMDTELRVIARDGEVRWIRLRAFPNRDGVKSIEGQRVVLIADDITDRKLEEETKREREVELVERARMQAVGDLADGVAHEINNPLTVIIGKTTEASNLVRNQSDKSASLLEAIEKIQKTSMRISEIISSLKSLSRQDYHLKARTSFKKILRDVGDLVAERFKAGGVRLEIAEAAEALYADVNERLISQLILNVLNNAYDAVQKESDKWVKLDLVDNDDSVFIYVSDSGPGIPIKHRGRIFDPFFTTKEPGKGTGLGLSLAASIAAHHGGMLRLDTMNSHTCFVAQIPKKAQR